MQDRLEEITLLVNGQQSFSYTLSTGRNYAVGYWYKSYSMNLLLTGPASNSTN